MYQGYSPFTQPASREAYSLQKDKVQTASTFECLFEKYSGGERDEVDVDLSRIVASVSSNWVSRALPVHQCLSLGITWIFSNGVFGYFKCYLIFYFSNYNIY